MDTKEEGEISLDDVSSSEETNHNNWLKKEKKLDMDRKYDKRVEVDILPQDAVYGKENRQYSNELHTYDIKVKPPPLPDDLSKDGLLPISSDEDDKEVVRAGDNSVRMMINLGPKRKRKKKKKKKTGQRLLVLDDLESVIETPTMPTRITGDEILTPPSHYESNELHKKYSPPSSKLYRSPVNHFKTTSHHPRALSPRRRSPRRLSPERSIIIDRYSQYKSSREHSSRRDEMLLKKVRQFDNRHKETSVKDRLFSKGHVLKSGSDKYLKENGDVKNHKIKTYDVEDEEDVDQLRRAALETKLQKSERNDVEIIKDSKTESEDNSSLNYNAGDQDEEDLELRMIALRSAFQKKHRDRVQRGVVGKNKNVDRRDKSPSSDSFLDDLFNDFKELDKEPTTAEGVDVEDMDLDSDVEREKENQPYSPTDGLSDDKYSDTEIVEQTNRVSINSYPTISRAEYNAPVPTYNQEFYPQLNRMPHPESVYPPSDPIQPSTINRYLGANQFDYNASYIRPMPPRIGAVPTSSRAETPYSPTDTPSFDPELPVCPSELSFVDNVTNATTVPYPNNSYLNNPMLRPHNNGPNYIPPPTELNKPTAPPMTSHFSRDPRRTAALSRGVIPIPTQPQKTTPLEQSSVKPVENPKKVVTPDLRIPSILAANKQDDRFEEIMKSLEEYTSEPAYLQGIPQVTKDANKIPTLVNRTLVPAPILKTNKQLQQKLPTKKPDDTTEKTFKSAEMQPVEIANQSKSSSTFKPIKFPSKVRKIQLIDLPVKGFNPINEPSTAADKASENSGAVDLSKNGETSATEAEVKKKGRRPKTPTIRKTTSKKSPVKDSNKASSKSVGRRTKENNKEVDNPLEEREKVNEGEAKRPRGRPRSVHRTDKNEEENKKRESVHRTAKEKTLKILETNSKENDKKRRSSADEDEEALRASVLASMYTLGAKKTRDDLTDKTKIDNIRDKSLLTSSTINEKSTISTSKNNSTLINNVNSMSVNNKSSIIRNTVGNATSNILVNARKRPGTTDVFGPPEKVLKKTTMNSKNPLDNLTKNLAAPASPKMSKNVSRVVINLGEDSDSDSDGSDYSSPLVSHAPSVPSTDFDKKLDEFLKSQREKLEINSKNLSTPTGNKTTASMAQKTSILGSTPLAVRHLPVSKQEEYRRLKQQLAEKEKQKLIRASEKSLQKSTKAVSKSAEENAQVTATNLQVKKTTRSSKSTAGSSISTSPPSNNPGLFTNIPKPSKISTSLTPASENLHPLTNIYPNNLIDTSLAEEQELLLPLDFSIKPDPDDFITITDEPKVDPLIIESVSQNCGDEINYDMPLESLGMRENLIIQISNVDGDNMANQRKVLFAKDLAPTEDITPYTPAEEVTSSTPVGKATSSTPAAPVLKILTTAQLNMRIEQESPSTNQEEMEEKVRLDENGQVIMQNTQPPIENNNPANDLASQIPPVVPKLEPVTDSSEQRMPIPSIQVTSATESSSTIPIEPVQVNVNTEESAPSLPPKKEPEVESPTQTETVTPMIPINVIKSEVEENLETYSKLPIEEQKTKLSKIENDLVKKRYNVLSDVTEMIENLQLWEIEQNAKIKLAENVAKLRLELKMAEERLEEQKLKVNNMGPKIKRTHSTINVGRSECVKLTKLCQGLGVNVSGNEYKIPGVGADVLTNKLKDIANYTQQLFKKKEEFNKQNNNMGLTPPAAHKNPTESNGFGKPKCSEEQSVPLNLSVQPTPEVNENLPTVKTEEPENQNLNLTPITAATTTTTTSDVNSTSIASSASIINSSSVTDSTSINNATLPVQPDLSVNISQNQETSNEFSLSKVKTEPVDVNEIESLENTPMEIDNGNETIKDTQTTQVTEQIAQIKTEKVDDGEINESISICNNTALKEEKDDTQPEENCENISNNNVSIRVIPSERLIGQRNDEDRTKEANTEATDKQQIDSVGVNNKTAELSFNVNLDVYKKETPEIEKSLGDNQIQNIEIKSETNPLLGSDLEGNDMNIVGHASERSTAAVVTNTSETWADFEEDKPPVTGVSYESVLTAFNTTRPVDPNGVLCPFELMGTCKDDSCTYNHLNADRKT